MHFFAFCFFLKTEYLFQRENLCLTCLQNNNGGITGTYLILMQLMQLSNLAFFIVFE